MRIALLLIVFLAGCSSFDPKWTKAEAGPQDFKVDNVQCEAQALAASNAISTMITHINYTGCMKAKGWTPPEIPKEEHEAPKHEAAKQQTAKSEAPKHESSGHETPKAEAAKH